MQKLVFSTGNKSKFYEASRVCEEVGFAIEQAVIDIDEIQHDDPAVITKLKAKSAYEKVKRPVVVNDSSWDIPALGGFPGPYMKDVSNWLSADDFLNLMRDKRNNEILLHEYVAFYDGKIMNLNTHVRKGHFVSEPRGESLPNFGRVVEMEGDEGTISEIFDRGNWKVSDDYHKHWYDFAKWYRDDYLAGDSVR